MIEFPQTAEGEPRGSVTAMTLRLVAAARGGAHQHRWDVARGLTLVEASRRLLERTAWAAVMPMPPPGQGRLPALPHPDGQGSADHRDDGARGLGGIGWSRQGPTGHAPR